MHLNPIIILILLITYHKAKHIIRHKGVKYMSHQLKFGVFGGDLRQVYMAESFLLQGYPVGTYHIADTVNHKNCFQAHTLNELFDYSDVLIGPIPMSKDQIVIVASSTPSDFTIAHVAYLLNEKHILIAGNIPPPIVDLCNSKNIPFFDLMKNDTIAALNTIATAEGTIMEAIASSNRNLQGSNCLVLGYGRCAKVLARKLKALEARVTIAARSTEAIASACSLGNQGIHLNQLKDTLSSFDYIFNTIPALILDKEYLDLVAPSVTMIDIASAPGGIDFAYAKELKLNAKLCLGLPGKVAPKTSSDIQVTEILAFLKERSD